MRYFTRDRLSHASSARSLRQRALYARSPRARSFRPEIEGLRGLAVIGVVANHAFGWPSGGYLGVDVFFVISGFLITGILLSELGATERIDIPRFIARRAKRLLPSALVVIAVTTIAAGVLWYAPRALSTALDAIAAASFMENWHLVATRTIYLRGDGDESPLQHFWSLGVEEQFYAAWPLALAVIALTAHRHRLRAIACVTAALCIGSFGYAVWRMGASPATTYFDTVARSWELLVGAGLALLRPVLVRGHAPLRRAAVAIGTATVTLALVLPIPVSSVPGVGALLPVGGAALVIGFAHTDTAGASRLLTGAPLRLVGAVSYSLYLWHFPAVVFTFSLVGKSLVGACLALLVTVVTTAIAYNAIEKPSTRWSRQTRITEETTRARKSSKRRRLLGSVGTVAVLTTLFGLQSKGPEALVDATTAAEVLGRAAPSQRFDEVEGFDPTGLTTGPGRSGPVSASIPAQLDDLYLDRMAPELHGSHACLFEVTSPSASHVPCRSGPYSASRTAVVLGDSVAASWMPMVTGALVQEGWQVVGLFFGNCSVMDIPVANERAPEAFTRACLETHAESFGLVERLRPNLLVLSGNETVMSSIDDSGEPVSAGPLWSAAVSRTVSRLSAFADHTAILSNPPMGPAPSACATRATDLRRCDHSPSAAHKAKVAAEKAAAVDLRAHGVSATAIDATDWFCGETCPIAVGDHVVRVDDVHLTRDMSAALATVGRRALLAPLERD